MKMKERVTKKKHCSKCNGYYTMIQIWDCSNCGDIEFILEDKK